MNAFFAWLIGVVTKDVMQFLTDWLVSYVKKKESAASDHQASVDQANKDNEKAVQIKPGSSSDEIDKAGDDSLSHL